MIYCYTIFMLTRRERIQKAYQQQRLILKLMFIIIILFILGFIFSLGLFAWYAKDLPSPGKLSVSSGNSTVFYDRDGKILYEMYKDKNRVPVSFSEISDYLKKATVSIEDKNFYKHQGISETGIIRAFLSIIFRRRLEGGSTITQQLIKNVLLSSERTFSRKIKEMILALEVERRYSKDQILEMYLNEAPYGGSLWGVASASMAYFGKQPKDLDLVESAILAGLPQSPTYYSPFIGKNDAWRSRAKDVLRRMREDGYISKTEEDAALKKLASIKFNTPKITIRAPHFVFYVKDQIEKEFGPKILDTGVKIKTTLSLDIQEKAEKIVKEEIEKLKGYNATNASAVVLDVKTGDILAMVGAYDFNDEKFGKFNVATQGLRQPGSAIKPITYALAFEKGYTPASVLMDVKTVFPNQGGKDYIPENYDGKFRGPVQLRFALGNSINVPAVKLLAMVGIHPFLQKAYEMGLTSFAPTEANLARFGLSITLGGGETNLLDLTSVFSVFARGGLKKDYRNILEITDFKGKKIYQSDASPEKQVLSKEVSFLISHILSDNNARVEVFGPNSFLKIPGKTVAVKTGTTDDKRDNWTIGYTKSVAVGVWVGNNDNTPMNPKIASGVTGASPIWHYLMSEILKKYPDGIIDKPDKVKALQIDAFLGGLPKDGYPTRAEYFIEGTEPKEVSPFYKRVGDKDYVVIKETDPVSTDGVNRWQQGIDDWVKSQSDEKYHPPEITPTVTSEPTKQENQPTNTPSLSPTVLPTLSPTLSPTSTPALTPTGVPSPT
jgi:1A family penicillin-binding protein